MITHQFRTLTPLALLGAALVCAACGKKDAATTDSTSTMTSTASTTTAGGSSTTAAPATGSAGSANGGTGPAAPVDPSQFTDANILAKELVGDSGEVVLAGVAKSMATNPAVKAYAAELIADHSKGMKETAALATKLSITPAIPAGDTTSVATSNMQAKLQGLAKGPAFDTVFVNHEIEDHKDDIKDAKAMVGAAKAPEVKALVQKSLPELQKHLDRAQKIASAKK